MRKIQDTKCGYKNIKTLCRAYVLKRCLHTFLKEIIGFQNRSSSSVEKRNVCTAALKKAKSSVESARRSRVTCLKLAASASDYVAEVRVIQAGAYT